MGARRRSPVPGRNADPEVRVSSYRTASVGVQPRLATWKRAGPAAEATAETHSGALRKMLACITSLSSRVERTNYELFRHQNLLNTETSSHYIHCWARSDVLNIRKTLQTRRRPQKRLRPRASDLCEGCIAAAGDTASRAGPAAD